MNRLKTKVFNMFHRESAPTPPLVDTCEFYHSNSEQTRSDFDLSNYWANHFDIQLVLYPDRQSHSLSSD